MGDERVWEKEVRALHAALLDAWNQRDAAGMGALCSADVNVVGFDGSPTNGRDEVVATMSAIFAHHPTASFVAIVRSVRRLAEGVALLRADVGMHHQGEDELIAGVNAIQSLVAARGEGGWRVELFHNTPAAFHGRPERSDALTAELTAVLRSR